MALAVLSWVPGRIAVAPIFLALTLLAGCGGLPEADGTEAAIAAKAQGLPALRPAPGQDVKSMARNGLLRSPSVREAASLISASANEVRVQRAVLFPSLGLSLGAGAGAASRGDPSLELSGQQLLLDFGDTKRAVTAADLDLQINYISFQKTVDDALIELLTAFDSVRMYGELLEVYRSQLAAMHDLEALIAERTESGAVSTPDLLETRKQLQSASFLVHDTELALAEARDRLIRLSGQAQGGPVSVPGGGCATPGGTDEMRMQRLRLARAKINVQRAERARYPRVSIAPITRSTLSDGEMTMGVNFGINSDLLQGGALTARADAARNTYTGALAAVEAADLDAELDERKLRRDIASSTRKMEMLRRQIDLLEETRVLYRSQYFDLGTRQLSELLDNEEEYYTRQAELIEEQSSLVVSGLDCAARNRSLRTSLGLEDNSLYDFPLESDAI